jgi:hypothetical protein
MSGVGTRRLVRQPDQVPPRRARKMTVATRRDVRVAGHAERRAFLSALEGSNHAPIPAYVRQPDRGTFEPGGEATGTASNVALVRRNKRRAFMARGAPVLVRRLSRLANQGAGEDAVIDPPGPLVRRLSRLANQPVIPGAGAGS